MDVGSLVTGIIVVVLGALMLVDGVLVNVFMLVDGVLLNVSGSPIFFGNTNPAFVLAVGVIALIMGGSLLQAGTKKK